MTSELAAVLWDMDGTLVDTEPYWMRAEQELVQSGGGSWTDEDGLQMVGLSLPASAALLKEAGAPGDVEEIYQHLTDRVDDLLRTEGIVFRPGARELLTSLRETGIRTGLVTMSLRRMADTVVSLLAPEDFADGPAFDIVVTGDEVTRPKPYPDPYLQAAEMLGIDVRQTVVIEDSPNGLRSGIAAEAVTIGVPHFVSLDDAGSDLLWQTLSGRTADDIISAYRLVRAANGGQVDRR